MPIDLSQIIQAAANAALEGQSSGQQASPQDAGKRKRKGLTAPRAILIGAGAVAAGRLLVGSRGRDFLENFQHQLASLESDLLGGGQDEDQDDFDEDYDEDEEPEGEYDEDEEPEGEYDEDEEPEGEYDEDEEPEGEYDEEDEPVDEESQEEKPRRRRRTSAAGSRNGRD